MGRTKSHAHAGSCQMGTCSCGDHQICKKTEAELGYSAGTCTEYVANYMEWPLEGRVRGKPLIQQLSVGGEFTGVTENQEKFVTHPIPPVFVTQKAVWKGTDLPFDGTTTQRTDFPAWEISARHPREKPEWISSSGKFDSQTTSKTDFRDMGLQPRFLRKPQLYIPNTAKFDGMSSHREAFQSWPVSDKPVGRHHDKYLPLKDDRDFKSTSAAAYVDHPMDAQFSEQKTPPPPHHYSSNPKFEGQTTSQDAYRKWNTQPRERRAKVEWVPNRSKFPSETTYTDNFKAKVASSCDQVRISKYGPTYNPVVSCKFDSVSTHTADYLPTGNVQKLADFAPKKRYVHQKDDRDFITSSRKAHDLKSA